MARRGCTSIPSAASKRRSTGSREITLFGDQIGASPRRPLLVRFLAKAPCYDFAKQLLSGRELAAAIQRGVSRTAEILRERGVAPGLAVILVGSDPASRVYVGAKSRADEACGIATRTYTLPDETEEHVLVALIEELNADPAVHGILLQLPLPAHLDEETVLQTVAGEKDVDGFHYSNIGKTAAGKPHDAFVPCTPAGILALPDSVHGEDLSGNEAVVVGHSDIVDKPMAALLLSRNATVTTAHSRTAKLDEVCRRADILVLAVGRPALVKGIWIKPGCIVIDVGINRISAPDAEKRRFVGDVDFAEAVTHAALVTPVPGGVGPMAVAMLMANSQVCRHARI